MGYQTGLPQAQCTVSGKRMMCKQKKEVEMCVYSRCFYLMLCLTIWMLISFWGLSNEARDWRKGSMAGSESCPQLISIRIFTFFSNAAVLMASSMNDQYLVQWKDPEGQIKQEEFKGNFVLCVCVCGWGSPLRLLKASGGEILHDGYIDIVLGLRDGGENSLKVLSPRWRTERWWRTLGWNTNTV